VERKSEKMIGTVVVYSPENSNRLAYVLDWLLQERLQVSYRITNDASELTNAPMAISYGRVVPGVVSIPDKKLLWQKGGEVPTPEAGQWEDIPTLFAENTGAYAIPFDLFSAIFFLLSRLEEYGFYKPDKHGRYPATASILYKKGWLTRPIVDEWVWAFRELLCAEYGFEVPPSLFTYQPTYDIDIAYSHLYKGPKRTAGGYIRSILKIDVAQIKERTSVLRFRQKDPYDSFRWLRQIHKAYACKPIYFVLAALKTTAFDKNIHPEHPAMVRVIKNIVKDGEVGMHPSYYSTEDSVVKQEKKILESIVGSAVNMSRQHYIKMKVPETYRRLQQNGITDDYSMGYGAHLGFRAGTGSSFMWYDVERDVVTTLRIHPFCFMDSTAHHEQKLTVGEAFDALKTMGCILQKTGSTLTTVFHNFSLGTSREWKGWRQAYEHFLHEKKCEQTSLPEKKGVPASE
jgi:hypothetical protein